jgi:hypothetical protein
MASVDPGMPIISIQTLREKVGLQFTQQRLIAHLTSFFGVLSLILASIGLYGVIAYNAGRRVNEVSVRIALGATRGDVVRLILKGAFGLLSLPMKTRLTVQPVFFVSAFSGASIRPSSLCFMFYLGR